MNEVVTAYGAAWNETDEAARRKLLDHGWVADGVYCDPSCSSTPDAWSQQAPGNRC